jgi:hypothetical protein
MRDIPATLVHLYTFLRHNLCILLHSIHIFLLHNYYTLQQPCR